MNLNTRPVRISQRSGLKIARKTTDQKPSLAMQYPATAIAATPRIAFAHVGSLSIARETTPIPAILSRFGSI
jgi:hypothetical protein